MCPSRHPDNRGHAPGRSAGPGRDALPVGSALRSLSSERAAGRSMRAVGLAGRPEPPAVAAQQQPRRAGAQAAPRGRGAGGVRRAGVSGACGGASCVAGRRWAGRASGGTLLCAMRCSCWACLARKKGILQRSGRQLRPCAVYTRYIVVALLFSSTEGMLVPAGRCGAWFVYYRLQLPAKCQLQPTSSW